MRLIPLALALILAAGPAVAQQARDCQAFVTLAAKATARGIEIVASGPTESGNAVVVYRAKDDASWAIFEVTPAGKACLVGNGTDLEVVAPGVSS